MTSLEAGFDVLLESLGKKTIPKITLYMHLILGTVGITNDLLVLLVLWQTLNGRSILFMKFKNSIRNFEKLPFPNMKSNFKFLMETSILYLTTTISFCFPWIFFDKTTRLLGVKVINPVFFRHFEK